MNRPPGGTASEVMMNKPSIIFGRRAGGGPGRGCGREKDGCLRALRSRRAETAHDRKGAQDPAKVLCLEGGPPQAGEAQSEPKEGVWNFRDSRRRLPKHTESDSRLAEVSGLTTAPWLPFRDSAGMLLSPPRPEQPSRSVKSSSNCRTFDGLPPSLFVAWLSATIPIAPL